MPATLMTPVQQPPVPTPGDVVALQAVRAAPAVSVLLATSPQEVLAPEADERLGRLLDDAARRLRREASDDVAAAVSARVHPVVSSYDVPLTAVPLLLPRGRARWTRWRLRRTLRLLAGRSGAELVVVPARHIFGFAPQAVAALVPGGVVAHPTGATRAGRV